MSDPSLPATNSKYAWHDVRRVEPRKRSAEERKADFHEVYFLYDEATVRAQASRCVQCAEPFCSEGCSLGNRIPEWLGLVAEGRFKEAAAISLSTSNMPEICSRLCPQERLCENLCVLSAKGDPIPIGAIEEFVIEWAFAHDAIDVPFPRPNGLSVAVVGSGPAGLACADELAKRGYAVMVFESQPVLGGLLVAGVPSFRLDRSVVNRRVTLLEKRGVTFRTNCTIGRDVSFVELLANFNAVFLAMGAVTPRPLELPGTDLDGVHQALPFLLSKNLGPAVHLPPVEIGGKRVVVLGGDDIGLDSARMAVRSGAASALCICRRDLDHITAAKREYKNAVEEGVKFAFLAVPVALEGDAAGRLTDVRCVRTTLSGPNAAGEVTPQPVPGTEFAVPADVALVAYGFNPAPLPSGEGWDRIAVQASGAVTVDPNQMTSLPRVFCGGGQVRGSNLVGVAVCDGRKAADGIHRFLSQQK